ncbi:hypothetical protein EJ02DRAFT_167255 [Clathrospora elynae]|uniref:Uncharacterized protein n=1 Tax=Clathrospora elynae TaxID=706981 RepID=A0A6A5S5J0_9PLEO|nr:hypothetical protein EJ02DRAFT_167255 [Clathrospora elynae]
METLPLELREQITSFLLPRANRKAITAAPFSSKAERTDIYNLRLTSHRINAGASQAFLKVIGDVPTKCTKSSLHSLANLVALEDVGKHITTLAFNTCALFLGEKKRYLNDIRFSAFERSLWITTTLGDELVKILRKTPRLRHLTYLRQEPEVRYHRVFGRESLDIAVILGRMQKPIEPTAVHPESPGNHNPSANTGNPLFTKHNFQRHLRADIPKLHSNTGGTNQFPHTPRRQPHIGVKETRVISVRFWIRVTRINL